MPNGDVMETVLNTNFDWNGARQPVGVVATENDSLNGASMLFGYLLTNTPQIFSDVRTYWSPESVKRVTVYELEGHAKDGFLDLRNSGSTTLDGAGKATRRRCARRSSLMRCISTVLSVGSDMCTDMTRRTRPSVRAISARHRLGSAASSSLCFGSSEPGFS